MIKNMGLFSIALVFLLLVVNFTSALQPKVLGVSDNLGHSCEFSSIDENNQIQQTYDWGKCYLDKNILFMSVEENLEIKNDITIKLSISKINKDKGDIITYSSRFWGNEPRFVLYNSRDDNNNKNWVEDSSNEWILNKSHYSSREYFRFEVKNQDEISYINSDDGDFLVDVAYENPILQEDNGISNEEQNNNENLESDNETITKTNEDITEDNTQEQILKLNDDVSDIKKQIENNTQEIIVLNQEVEENRGLIEKIINFLKEIFKFGD